MGVQQSSEAGGVSCETCHRALPPNNWKFKGAADWCWFYDETADRRAVIRYGRPWQNGGRGGYQCVSCIERYRPVLFERLCTFA